MIRTSRVTDCRNPSYRFQQVSNLTIYSVRILQYNYSVIIRIQDNRKLRYIDNNRESSKWNRSKNEFFCFDINSSTRWTKQCWKVFLAIWVWLFGPTGAILAFMQYTYGPSKNKYCGSIPYSTLPVVLFLCAWQQQYIQ